MKRDYLKELGIDVEKEENWLHQRDISNIKYESGDRIPLKRTLKWKREREQYGIDSRDSWNMDTTMLLTLYEQLRMYCDEVKGFIDLDFQAFVIFGKARTQGQWIEKILRMINKCIREEIPDFVRHPDGSASYPRQEVEKNIWKIYAEISPSMWW